MFRANRQRVLGIVVTAALTAAAGLAWSYPPKPADWDLLSVNAGSVIAAWDRLDFVAAYNGGDLSDPAAFRAAMRGKMTELNGACQSVRDQIGTGGLFGPEMWTQGFRQTCWALATFQKDGTASAGAKLCGETKDALNFFKQFKASRAPAQYPEAAADVARFVEINQTLRQTVKGCK